jgi:hypothetical protein
MNQLYLTFYLQFDNANSIKSMSSSEFLGGNNGKQVCDGKMFDISTGEEGADLNSSCPEEFSFSDKEQDRSDPEVGQNSPGSGVFNFGESKNSKKAKPENTFSSLF